MKPSKKKLLSCLLILSLSCCSLLVPDSAIASASCGHEWGEWTLLDEPTCIDPGAEIRICRLCSWRDRRPVPSLGHKWDEGEIETKPSCFKPGVKRVECMICGETKSVDIPANGQHKWEDWEIWVKPTCNTGYKIRMCEVCQEIEDADIPAISKHKWSSWKVKTKPTIFNKGHKIRTCSVCDEVESVDIAKLKATATDKQVQKAMNNFFAYAKAYNIAKIKNCFSKPSSVSLFSSKKELANFCKKYSKKITYTFKDLKVSKNTATVKVTCKYYDAYNAHYSSIHDAYLYILTHYPNYSESYVNKLQYQSLVKWNKQFKSEYSTKTITFKLNKVGSTWKIISYTKAMADMLHQNYQSAYTDYFN